MVSRLAWMAPPPLILACYHRLVKSYLCRIERDKGTRRLP